MALILIVLFLIGPIAEIYVLLTAGSLFGVLPVVVACVATAVIGGAILRAQGISALNTVQKDMQEGRVPVAAAADGIFIALSAPFLMTPGFLTDIAGFALLTPPIRAQLIKLATRYLASRAEARAGIITINRPEP
ncbi:MAG: FxsA family protein [Pseudomonadota bacterium]